MQPRISIEEIRRAIHESGHAVVARVLGVQVIHLSIEQEGEQVGVTQTAPVKCEGYLRDIYDAMMATAGLAAEEIATGTTIRRMSGTEAFPTSDAAVFKRLERKRGNEFVGRCYNSTRKILAANWKLVHNLAVELAAKKRLDWEEIYDILANPVMNAPECFKTGITPKF